MFKKTESLAWLILMVSFSLWLALLVGTPLAVRRFLRKDTRPLEIVLQPRGGTVTQQVPGNGRPELMNAGQMFEVQPRSRVQLEANADALLLFYEPDSKPPIVTVQLYGETELLVENARTPRFDVSPLPHAVSIHVDQAANVRFSVEGNGRATAVEIHTPHGVLEAEEGTYAVIVGKQQTEFSVRAGHARVPNPKTGEIYVLTNLQRIEVTPEGLGDVSVAERNILSNRNGSFDQPLEQGWQSYTDTAYPEQDGGNVQQVQVGDERSIVLFSRVGQGWAETGITQEINQDIRGARSLKVSARVRVDVQKLSVCGSRGTECPIMLEISYADQQGTTGREWLQGFYAVPGPDEPFCQVCEWKAQHEQVPQLNVWYDYESPDLLPLMREQGIEPAIIESVRIYASGHTYGSAVDEIAIIVGE